MSRQPELHITSGLPASGKTTWATSWREVDPERRARVNRDEIRFMSLGTIDDCTHGGNCRIHPGVDGVHNFDQEEAA